MQLALQSIGTELLPKKPYLFFGPSNSGKKTAIKAAMQSRNVRPIVLSMHEAEQAEISQRDLFGRIGYIIYIDSIQILNKPVPGCIVCYVTLDAYALGSSDQLAAKFTLVDLGKQLHTVAGVDRELTKQPPWEQVKQICNPRSGYDSKLVVFERNPMLTQTLHNNVFGVMPKQKGRLPPASSKSALVYREQPDETVQLRVYGLEQLASTLGKLSELDRSFYVEHSGQHANLMEAMAMVSGLRLTGTEQYDWTKRTNQMRYKRPTSKQVREAGVLERYAALQPPATVVQPKTKARTAGAPSKRGLDPERGATGVSPVATAKTARAPPKCKKCNVPLKGHRCPHKAAAAKAL